MSESKGLKKYFVKPYGLGWTVTGPTIPENEQKYYDKRPRAIRVAKDHARVNRPSQVIPITRNNRIAHSEITTFRAKPGDADGKSDK